MRPAPSLSPNQLDIIRAVAKLDQHHGLNLGIVPRSAAEVAARRHDGFRVGDVESDEAGGHEDAVKEIAVEELEVGLGDFRGRPSFSELLLVENAVV